MKLRAVALAYGFGLVLATAAWAATPKTATTADAVAAAAHSSVEQGAMVPITWVPDWLMEPLSRAIADASDPRDRKSVN